MKNINKVIIACYGILAILALSSFIFPNKQPPESSSKNKVTKVSTKTKKPVSKVKNTEITETKIELTAEYRKLLQEDINSIEVSSTNSASDLVDIKVQPKTNKHSPQAVVNNPNKVHQFIRSKNNPNIFEVQ